VYCKQNKRDRKQKLEGGEDPENSDNIIIEKIIEKNHNISVMCAS